MGRTRAFTLCWSGSTRLSLVNTINTNLSLVRMRDDKLQTMPGVTIEDMGYKMGLNGVDNAKLS